MTFDNNSLPDKRKMREAFERAAPNYDEAAVLQQEVGQRLLERFDYIRFQPRQILDVGSGTGQCLAGLNSLYPRAQITALDLAHGMLAEARRKQGWWKRRQGRFKFVCGDAEQLPLADKSVDLLFSNLALQWCGDLPQTFREFRRVLKPGGLLMFSTFGPDTLKELRACWSQVDGYTHVNDFTDMHNIGDMLLHSRFAEPVMDMEMLTLTYQHARQIMQELKAIGAHNVTLGRPRGLTGKDRIKQVIQAYEQFRHQGVLPVTYEVVYGHAWVAEETLSASTTRVALTDIGKP